MAVEEGDAAPDFKLTDDAGEAVRLSDYRGRPVVLFFYPKDDTPGCTREAADFSAALPDFEAGNVAVIGISPDDTASHRRFRDKHGLTVRLLADPDRTALEAYGVWREKSLYGQTFLGVERSTFLIDADGRIARAWRRIRVPGHVGRVLEAAGALARG